MNGPGSSPRTPDPATPSHQGPAAPGILEPGCGAWLARSARAIAAAAVRGEPLPDSGDAPPGTSVRRAVFITVEAPKGEIHGCLGALEPEDSLAAEVRRLSVKAATRDRRFPPLRVEHLPRLAVKISILSEPTPLRCASPRELVRRLRPGVDGVILEVPGHAPGALFLPEVWEKLEDDARKFLAALCRKQRAPEDAWVTGFAESRVFTFRTEVYGSP